METVRTFAFALSHFLALSAPYIVIGYFVAALIKEFVPLKVFVRYFGGRGLTPLLRAVGVGALLPICSCGVIPVGIGAFKCGASRGTTLAFMTSGPTISPVAVLLAFSLLDLELAVTFVVAALVGSLVIGAVANRFLSGPEEDALRAASIEKHGDKRLPSSKNRTLPAKLRGAAKWAFWDLGTDISVDLLFGLCIAAGLLASMPREWISGVLGEQSFMSLVYVMLLGVPLYTCTVPSIPVTQSLLLLGVSPGAAITYLISGPATNLGEVNVIRKNLGGRTAAAFVVGLVALAIAAGLVTDWFILPGYEAAALSDGSRGFLTEAFVAPVAGSAGRSVVDSLTSVPAWHYPFMVVLAAALAIGLVRRGRDTLTKWRRGSTPGTKRDASRSPRPAAGPESGVASS